MRTTSRPGKAPKSIVYKGATYKKLARDPTSVISDSLIEHMAYHMAKAGASALRTMMGKRLYLDAERLERPLIRFLKKALPTVTMT